MKTGRIVFVLLGWTAAAVALTLCLAADLRAQDTVVIAGSTGGQRTIAGRVVDYSGSGLQFELPSGREETYPVEQVIEVSPGRTQKHADADASFAQFRFDEASARYRVAMNEEPRRWVRRQIVARMVWCNRALNKTVEAGEAFLLLVREDPKTPYFDSIPLAWMPRQPSPALEGVARRWLDDKEPAAALLGASHLLTGSGRPRALARLRELSTSSDRRIARLAIAQTWRAEPAPNDARLERWSKAVAEMGQSQSAGPYYVLGRARAGRGQWDRAALALLRVPILHPQQRELAAQALLDAGTCLEKLDRTREAANLYRELIGDYQETRSAAEAKQRLEAK